MHDIDLCEFTYGNEMLTWHCMQGQNDPAGEYFCLKSPDILAYTLHAFSSDADMPGRPARASTSRICDFYLVMARVREVKAPRSCRPAAVLH